MKKGIHKKCYCGNSFYEFPYQRGKKKYCSKNCANKANAEANSKSKQGEKNPMYGKRAWNYKDGTLTTKKRKVRYRLIYVNGKQIKEHVFLMEQKIGRKLFSNEVVHHINGDGTDNKLNNLQLMTNVEHNNLHRNL